MGQTIAEKILSRASRADVVYPHGHAGEGIAPGKLVEVQWKGSWYKASILAARDGKFKVHYEDWSDSWDEWVAPDRVRKLSSATTAAPVPPGKAVGQ